jgi:hypothetical protein
VRIDDEGRGEKDVIAAGAVDGALRGIGEDVSFECRLADFFGDGGFLGERFAGGFVFDEFDGLEQTEATNLAYMGMRFEDGERVAKSFTGGSDAIEEFVSFEEIENGVAGGGGDGMRLISEPVHEGGSALFESVDDAGSDEDCAERCVPAGDSLSGEDDVRLEGPVLASEGFSGAAHAGHDFVGKQEDAVAAADFGDTGGVAVDGGRGAERGANYGFENEGGDGGGVVGLEKSFEVIGAG